LALSAFTSNLVHLRVLSSRPCVCSETQSALCLSHARKGESKEVFFSAGPDTVATATDDGLEKAIHPGTYRVRVCLQPHTHALMLTAQAS
jgi:hypothetical protein